MFPKAILAILKKTETSSETNKNETTMKHFSNNKNWKHSGNFF